MHCFPTLRNLPAVPLRAPRPQELQRVMEGVGAGLHVPLACSAKLGRSWGSMQEVE